jgi:3'-5' exoribonuclease
LKNVYVKNIKEREWIEAPFLVRDKIIGMAKNGRPYLSLKLMDCTGEVEGRIWENVDEIAARFDKDDFIEVAGKASVYMGKMQLVIQQLSRLDETAVDLADFLPVAGRSIPDMVEELSTVVAAMQEPALQTLMEKFLADADFMAAYSRAPAAKTMHHVYLGGLLEHSLAVARLAEDICNRYPDLNRDLLIAGALLHDVGKVAELRYQRAFEYTDAGKLLGHIVIGVEMVDQKMRDIDDFPETLSIHLKHLLLSHHGQYEYGSPKRPKTIEAVILNFLDDLDSKINGVRTHIDREPDSDSSWTRYHRHYDRYFYKGDRSPAAPEPESESEIEKTARPAVTDSSSPSTMRHPKPRFSNTLGEQLKGKNLDLFGRQAEDKTDE